MRNQASLSVLSIALLCVMLLLPALACGQPPAATTGPSPSAGGKIKMGGIIQQWIDGEPGGYDTQRKLLKSPGLALPVFNNLVSFDPSKQELSPTNIRPDLAERWDIGPDGKTYTFYLAKGVKWHDGKAFTADDVVGNFQKLMDKNRSLMYTNFPTFENAVKVDDYTVKVTLKGPQPSFLPQLASAYAPMVPLHTGDPFKTTAFLVGTGPLKFKEYKTGVEYVYEKNADYFKKDEAGNKLPYVDGMSIVVIPDRAAEADATITKRCDIGMISGQELLLRYKQQAPDMIVQWWRADGQIFHMSQKFKPFSDIRVRKAMILVIDMEAAVVGAFGDAQFRVPDGAIMPKAYAIGKAEKYKLLGWDKPYDQRVAEAKKLMAEAGYGDGFRFRLLTGNPPELVRMCQFMADVYRRTLNVQAEILSFDYGTVAQKVATGDYDMYNSGLNAMAGDPDEILGSFKTGGADNRSFYSDAELDRMVQEQSVSLDVNKRADICRQIERKILTDAVVIPQGWASFAHVFWPHLKGFVHQDQFYAVFMQFERVWLDK